MGKRKLGLKLVSSSAIVDPTALIGEGSQIWTFAQIGEHATIGKDCVIANGVYVDRCVKVGNRVRIHNKALLYHGLVVEDDVFIGPGACFTNDAFPRSGKTRNLKGKHWVVGQGASIGANATILPDVNIGKYALIGAGSVVTKDVPNYSVVCGNPAAFIGLICRCGATQKNKSKRSKRFICTECKTLVLIDGKN